MYEMHKYCIYVFPKLVKVQITFAFQIDVVYSSKKNSLGKESQHFNYTIAFTKYIFLSNGSRNIVYLVFNVEIRIRNICEFVRIYKYVKLR